MIRHYGDYNLLQSFVVLRPSETLVCGARPEVAREEASGQQEQGLHGHRQH